MCFSTEVIVRSGAVLDWFLLSGVSSILPPHECRQVEKN